MRVYIGSTRKKDFCIKLQQKNVGRVSSPESFCVPYHQESWIADNGAYSAWLQGKQLNEEKYLAFLERAMQHPPPAFGVIPDIVADGDRSLEYSLDWAASGKLPREWRWYLAVQDGMSHEHVGEIRDDIDGVFIGGTLRFKAHAQAWKNLKLPVHFGRAGVHKRMHFAYQAGCDSCDSSFPLWTQERFDLFLGMIDDRGQYKPETYKQTSLL